MLLAARRRHDPPDALGRREVDDPVQYPRSRILIHGRNPTVEDDRVVSPRRQYRLERHDPRRGHPQGRDAHQPTCLCGGRGLDHRRQGCSGPGERSLVMGLSPMMSVGLIIKTTSPSPTDWGYR